MGRVEGLEILREQKASETGRVPLCLCALG